MKWSFATHRVRIPMITLTAAAVMVGASLGIPRAASAKSLVAADGSAQSKEQSNIQHVAYIIMDNVHYSDIQQMPHLMKFLSQGTLFTNDHTVLDSHTQDGMLSDMTGKYPGQTGVIDQGFYENGQYASFAYWTSTDPDGKPHVTTTPNWLAFNQHGLNVGAVGAPDLELESAKELNPSDLNPVDTKASDYLGIAVHKTDGSTVFGSPNLPYLFQAPSWTDASKTLGGFPGWGDNTDLNWSLQATYEMQTHDVPVTFTYLHDAHEVGGAEALPGTYGSTIQAYDDAFARFFDQMNTAGLNPSNTLFVMTTDEGDHLMPQGELSTNLTGWLANNSLYSQDPSNLTVYGDSGALVYLKDESALPKTLASLSAVPGWNYVADPTELKALHMDVTAAEDRNPSFVLFAKPDVYYGYSGSTSWGYNSKYVWNHGTISPDILNIWAGMVGPGVKGNQISTQWLDHADTMPTIYALMGYPLADAGFDGVPAMTVFDHSPHSGKDGDLLLKAESVYKQLNAPVGKFGLATLEMSTEAAVNATNSQGSALDAQINTFSTERDSAASALRQDILETLQGHPIPTGQLSADMDHARQILKAVQSFKGD